jgi:AcrR family transcriptional regulator
MKDKKAVKREKNLRSETKTPRTGLTRTSIIAAAMRIIDEEGYKALSMRRLGAALGVDPMAVYYHIPNKSALLDGLVDLVMSEIDLGRDDPSQPAEERLRLAAHVYREVLLAHPNAVHVIAVRPLKTPIAFRPVELLLDILLHAGFSPTDALAAVNIFARVVRGVVLTEVEQMADDESGRRDDGCTDECAGPIQDALPADEFPYMNEVMQKARFIGYEAEFDRGVRALIKGMLDTFANDGKER